MGGTTRLDVLTALPTNSGAVTNLADRIKNQYEKEDSVRKLVQFEMNLDDKCINLMIKFQETNVVDKQLASNSRSIGISARIIKISSELNATMAGHKAKQTNDLQLAYLINELIEREISNLLVNSMSTLE